MFRRSGNRFADKNMRHSRIAGACRNETRSGGACAEGHGYFGKWPESKPATVTTPCQAPQSESTLKSAVTSSFETEMGFGPVTALASCSAPLAAVMTSFVSS